MPLNPKTQIRPRLPPEPLRPPLKAHTHIPTDKTHTTDKPSYDIQSDASNKAQEDRKGSEGNSSATQESDQHNSNKRAEQETKAPKGTVIGMNDERGGKGL